MVKLQETPKTMQASPGPYTTSPAREIVMPIQCTCSLCGKTFFRPPCRVRVGVDKHCSAACSYADRKKSSGLEVLDDGTARIPLRRVDGSVQAYAIIDADDAEWVGQYRWSLSGRGYAWRVMYQSRRNRQPYLLHREILGLPPGDPREGDHINRDRLDNRRSNLRVIERHQNPQNTGSRTGSSSAFRGVSFTRRNGKWAARVSVSGREHWLGYFKTETEAADAARQARFELLPMAVD